MYTLYYSLGACSFAIHALLYALDVPFDTISSIRISNSYQDTGVITLNPATNFKKRFNFLF